MPLCIHYRLCLVLSNLGIYNIYENTCLFFKSSLTCNCSSVDLTRIMSHSRDYEELLHVWTAWRDAVGPPIRSKYIRYVQLANHAARLNGKQLFFINIRFFFFG